jgi:IclR family pca regulon transcriptional regulator
MNEPVSKNFLSTLANGLAVISAFTDGPGEMTVSEVARRIDLSRASARRILLTLQELGYVSANGRMFALKPAVLNLGYAYLSGLNWLGYAQNELGVLAPRLGNPCSAAILDGTDAVYVVRINPEPWNRVTMSISVGQRFPAYVTAFGRVLLFDRSDRELDQFLVESPVQRLTPETLVDPEKIKKRIHADSEQGYSFVMNELVVGVCSLAVPLRDATGEIFASVGVGWLTATASPQKTRDVALPALFEAAQAIRQALTQINFCANPGNRRSTAI